MTMTQVKAQNIRVQKTNQQFWELTNSILNVVRWSSNIPGYNSQVFEPGKKQDFDGQDTGFNESVDGDGLFGNIFGRNGWRAQKKQQRISKKVKLHQ